MKLLSWILEMQEFPTQSQQETKFDPDLYKQD